MLLSIIASLSQFCPRGVCSKTEPKCCSNISNSICIVFSTTSMPGVAFYYWGFEM
jgi:hypothetical protein